MFSITYVTPIETYKTYNINNLWNICFIDKMCSSIPKYFQNVKTPTKTC